MGINSSHLKENVTDAIYSEDVLYLQDLLKDISEDECKVLLSSKIPEDYHGRTFLHLASWSDNTDLLCVVLDKNVDVNIKDNYGWTPLMVSMYKGNIQNVYALLQRSAVFVHDANEAIWLLRHAVQHDLLAIVSVLLEKGTKLNDTQSNLINIAVDNQNVSMVRIILEKGNCNVNTLDELGWAPIHLASGHDNLAIVRLLMEFDADINLKDMMGNTPLAWADKYNSRHVKSELDKYHAICDDKWHERDNELIEESDSKYKTLDMSESDDEVFEDAHFLIEDDYIDQYRNEAWSEEMNRHSNTNDLNVDYHKGESDNAVVNNEKIKMDELHQYDNKQGKMKFHKDGNDQVKTKLHNDDTEQRNELQKDNSEQVKAEDLHKDDNEQVKTEDLHKDDNEQMRTKDLHKDDNEQMRTKDLHKDDNEQVKTEDSHEDDNEVHKSINFDLEN